MKQAKERIDDLPDALSTKLVELQYELLDSKLHFCWHCNPRKQAMAVFVRGGLPSHLAFFHLNVPPVVFPLYLSPPEVTIGKGFPEKTVRARVRTRFLRRRAAPGQDGCGQEVGMVARKA